MGLTVSLTGDWMESIGNKRASSGTITFDSSYPTGGESITAAALGLGRIDFIEFAQGTSGYIFEYVASTRKIKVYASTMGGTISGSSHTHDILIIGGQAAASTAAVAYYATDILGKEAATSKTIVGADSATKGGIVAVNPDSGVTVTGGATAEVANTTSLATVTVAFRAMGI